MNEDNPHPVGVFSGHVDGITHLDSKLDSRYLVTNSKDQTIKLWDIRAFSSKDSQESTRRAVANQNWDYRWQRVPKQRNKYILYLQIIRVMFILNKKIDNNNNYEIYLIKTQNY